MSLESIRKAPMLLGRELEVKDGKIILPSTEPNFNRVEFVDVLKEDDNGNPIWWCTHGINWNQFYATTKENAIELYKCLIGNLPDTDSGVIITTEGGFNFRLHK